MVPESGTVLILSPCENIHEMFETSGDYLVVRGRSGALGADLLANLRPDVVAAPVMGQERDILEIGEMLGALRFDGILCAVSKPPIRADLVMEELRAACPGLRICLVEAGRA